MPSSSVRGVKGYSMLAFDSVHLNDQGEYWCEANSTEGWNRSSTANVTGTKILLILVRYIEQLSYFQLINYFHCLVFRRLTQYSRNVQSESLKLYKNGLYRALSQYLPVTIFTVVDVCLCCHAVLSG